MQDVTVSKTELLEILEKNRDRHTKVLKAALEGYRLQLVSLLQDKLTELQAGKIPDVSIGLSQPSDHTGEYSRVIRMVQMHTGGTIMLDEHTFAMYVMDQWNWRRQWMRTSSSYAAAAVAENYGSEADED